jgi:hypothetical protein
MFRVDDLGSFISLEKKRRSGQDITLKEAFLLDYLNAAYPLSRLEIQACLSSEYLSDSDLLAHIMSIGESPFEMDDCDCPNCRAARSQKD